MASILPFPETEPDERPRLIQESSAIFWETANTRSFETCAAQDAYFRRWFGRYLDAEPERFYLALESGGPAIGYLAGCSDTFSEAARPLAEDVAFYTPALRATLSPYPSHFHINVKPGHRGGGLGRRLVARFIESLGEASACGVHVVTGVQSRAVYFYEACGFKRIAIADADPKLAVLVLPLSRREVGKT